MVDMASVVAPPASDFSTARVGPRPVRGLGEKGPRMNIPFPMSLGSTKEALSAKEGRPGEERAALHSGMDGIFQAGEKYADVHSVPPKPPSSSSILIDLSIINNYHKRRISTHLGLKFRPMMVGDCDVVRTIHEYCLPVHYSERFYNNACRNVINQSSSYTEMPIFTQVAVILCTSDKVQEEKGLLDKFHCQDGIMAGVVTAQMSKFIALPTHEFLRPSKPDLFPDAMYILTLCAVSDFRRKGIGSELLLRCMTVARANPFCGVVFLHVTTHNEAAVKFYEKQGFERIAELEAYYTIKGIPHNCFLYANYINGAQRRNVNILESGSTEEEENSLNSKTWSMLSGIVASVWHMFTRWWWEDGEKKLSILPGGSTPSHMDP